LKLFWLGAILGPLVWYVVLKTVWFIFIKQWRAIKDWYLGLPLVQWPAMLLLIIGTKVIRKKHCEVMRYNGRIWYSPKVAGFVIEDD